MPIICYDLRFPAWCRNTRNKYDTLIAVANWPKSRSKVWSTLLSARAIENQAYVCASNRIGNDDCGIAYAESSAIYDFKGNEISRIIGNTHYAELNYEQLSKFREKFPAWRDADEFNFCGL